MKSHVDLKYITLGQVAGCLLVILGHSFPFVVEYPKVAYDAREFLYCFHMPLFVFCSGLLFVYTNQSDKDFTTFLKKRAGRLLIPYFVISLIGLLPKILLSSFFNDQLSFNGGLLFRALLIPREGVWGHFWFLPMIFFVGIIGYIIDYISIYVKSRKSVWIIAGIIGVCMSVCKSVDCNWGGLNDIFDSFWCYTFGVLFSLYNIPEKIERQKKHVLFIMLSGFGLSIILFIFCKDCELVSYRNLVIAILMITCILFICIYIQDYTKISRKSEIAQTYQIFILSWPCQLVIGIILEKVLHMPWYIFMPSVFLAGVVLPIKILRLVDWFEKYTNNNIISFILGRS